MNRNALGWFFRRALLLSVPFTLGGASPNCEHEIIIPDGGVPTEPISAAKCNELCGGISCTVVHTDMGLAAVDCFTGNCGNSCGRLTDGLAVLSGGETPGAHFARMAELEAAAVHAFRRLARELSAHGAPARLVGHALAAARDETRHARVAARLARRFGGTPVEMEVPALPVRPLAEVVRENAVEGCVRETVGAAVASFQAEQSRDPQVRRALAAIAVDERRHAELSWAVARWADRELDQADRDRTRAARDQAAALLVREHPADPPPAVAAIAGLPSRAAALAIIKEARATIWS